MRVQTQGAVDGGTAENKKSISFYSPSAERNLKPCGMAFTPSAPGNTRGICHLPSGGGSALNQTQSLTTDTAWFPDQVRSTLLEMATDDDIWYLSAALTVLSSNTVQCSAPLCSCFAPKPQLQVQPGSCNCINKVACIGNNC